MKAGGRWLSAIPPLIVLLVAIGGPWLQTGSPTAADGTPFEPAGAVHPLGTDVLGRDVLARVLAGGRTIVLQAGVATLLGSIVGMGVGVWTALTHRRRVARLVLRVVDAVAVLPALLLLLLVGAGVPGNNTVVGVVVAAVSIPFSVRVLRERTARLAATGYARDSRARGEPLLARLRHDIVPGLAPVAAAEAGIRFVAATQLVATAGFLGLGAGAPAANWGRMVRENSAGIATNAWSVVVPALLVVVLAVGTAVLLDRVGGRARDESDRMELEHVGRAT